MTGSGYLKIYACAFIISLFSACSNKTLGPEIPPPTPTVIAPQFVSVPGGTYEQAGYSTTFTHTISSFQTAKFETSYELWRMVRTWALSHGYSFQKQGREGSDGVDGAEPAAKRHEPATNMTWRDALVWCNAYSEMLGKTPVYCRDAAFLLPVKTSFEPAYEGSINTMGGSSDNPYVNWTADGFRLPTEGEWQYAARYIDGSSWNPPDNASGAAADYNDLTATAACGWFNYNSLLTTHGPGLLLPNSLGLYDMSGNAAEMCWDWYDSYPAGTVTDYRGAATGLLRSAAGGAYWNSSSLMRPITGSAAAPYTHAFYTGFRLARSIP